MRQISLDQVHIPKACTASWDSMHGDDGRRFCDICQKDVHNVAALPRAEGTELVNSGHACVRILQDARACDVVGRLSALPGAGVSQPPRVSPAVAFCGADGDVVLDRMQTRRARPPLCTPQPAPQCTHRHHKTGRSSGTEPPACVDPARDAPDPTAIIPTSPLDGVPKEWLGKVSSDLPVNTTAPAGAGRGRVGLMNSCCD